MISGRKKGKKKRKASGWGAVPLVRLWDATKINKESRPAKGEGDGGVSWRARRREMKVGTLSHSCQQFLMQTLLLIGRASQVLPPNLSSAPSLAPLPERCLVCVCYEESSIRFVISELKTENLFSQPCFLKKKLNK